jgi:heme-degrading monooxygenase HmoA
LKNTCKLFVALPLLVAMSAGQNPPAAPTARTDLYHVHFAKAALGKGAAEGDYSTAAMPGHYLVLRHQAGEDWDYAVIEHLGTKTTVDAAGTPAPAAARDLGAWHTDTFVNGPAWPEFARAMGIDESSAGKTAGSVYVVSVYRAAPGHRDELEKMLAQAPADTASGNILMQHVEGGPWTYLTIARYNSWEDYATGEKSSVAAMSKNQGPWFALRDHATFHNDTVTDRIAP